MTNPLESKICEVCSAPATTAVADSKELPPDEDGAALGGYHSRFEVQAVHCFCDAHKRRARRKLLNGQVMEGAPV